MPGCFDKPQPVFSFVSSGFSWGVVMWHLCSGLQYLPYCSFLAYFFFWLFFENGGESYKVLSVSFLWTTFSFYLGHQKGFVEVEMGENCIVSWAVLAHAIMVLGLPAVTSRCCFWKLAQFIRVRTFEQEIRRQSSGNWRHMKSKERQKILRSKREGHKES